MLSLKMIEKKKFSIWNKFYNKIVHADSAEKFKINLSIYWELKVKNGYYNYYVMFVMLTAKNMKL